MAKQRQRRRRQPQPETGFRSLQWLRQRVTDSNRLPIRPYLRPVAGQGMQPVPEALAMLVKAG